MLNPTTRDSSRFYFFIAWIVLSISPLELSAQRLSALDPLPVFEWEGGCKDSSVSFAVAEMRDQSKRQYLWQIADNDRYLTGPKVEITFTQSGAHDVSLLAVGKRDTQLIATRSIYIHPTPAPIHMIRDTICAGEAANLGVKSHGTLQTSWYQVGKMVGSGEMFQTSPLTQTTTYEVVLRDSIGCQSPPLSIQAVVRSNDDLALWLPRTEISLPLAKVEPEIKTSLPITSWKWDFGDGNISAEAQPIHSYQKPGIYAIRAAVTTQKGCTLTQSQKIEVLAGDLLAFPQSFSPNGDGISDTFQAQSVPLQSFLLKVFNRTGKLVYQTSSPAFIWDGKNLNGSPLPASVYVCVVEALTQEGENLEKRFNLLLIR